MLPVDCHSGIIKPDLNFRFRPEFLQHYPTALCSDAFSEWSAMTLKEKDVNDLEVVQASKFLMEYWIPSFVKKLDYLELRPVTSLELTQEFHKSGINMRYLGE